MTYFTNKHKNNLIKLIISVCNNKKDDTIELANDEVKIVIKIAAFHSLDSLIYAALKLNNIEIPKELEELHKTYSIKALTQDCELESICTELSKNKIYHLPLKGAVMRTYYPVGWMRSMADLDILVDVNELKHVGEIVKELGYEVEHLGGNHDSYMKKPFMNIEIHRAMVDEQYHMHDYYLDIWNKVIKDNYSCKLSDEDFYIFNIIHAGKHFSHGGTGLRVLVDLHYYLAVHQDLNFEYIYQELAKVSFDTFGKLLKDLSDALFSYQELDEDKYILLEYIIDCGTYGTVQNSSVTGVIKEEDEDLEKAKKNYLLQKIFPPYKIMVRRNPCLKKVPILLPWFWITRLIKGMFHFKTYNKQVKGIKNIDQTQVEKIKRIKEITKIRS